MDDLSVIVWAIVVAVLIILNSVVKMRKKSAKQRRVIHEHHDEEPIGWGFSPSDDVDRSRSNTSNDLYFEEESEATKAPISPLHGMTSSETFMEGDLSAVDASEIALGEKGQNAVMQNKRIKTGVQDEPLDEIIQDFDLRKAVIYSEILKPKFDE